ncbi:hypothetical protein D9757_001465 [Collybiopsis confluens]|uniref:Uncharacterized protein n=1 Tax=Collybiopsis confluens TaxID=2823264 RepID=A0A8H5HZN2_9AGAR|nr:hypothetical protein D9757_001465 [Collybiopsis confluens]
MVGSQPSAVGEEKQRKGSMVTMNCKPLTILNTLLKEDQRTEKQEYVAQLTCFKAFGFFKRTLRLLTTLQEGKVASAFVSEEVGQFNGISNTRTEPVAVFMSARSPESIMPPFTFDDPRIASRGLGLADSRQRDADIRMCLAWIDHGQGRSKIPEYTFLSPVFQSVLISGKEAVIFQEESSERFSSLPPTTRMETSDMQQTKGELFNLAPKSS